MSNFARMTEKYFKKVLDYKPVWGSDLGLEEYDPLLPRGDRAFMDELCSFYRSFQDEVKSFPDHELTFDERIDKECLTYATDLELFRLTEMEIWRSYPTGPDTIGSALYTLISRDSSPFEERLKSIISRMQKAPAYVAETRQLLDKPVWIWTEIGIESCHRMKGYIEYIEEMAGKLVSNQALLGELHDAAIEVKNTFKEHEKWLYNDVLPKATQNFQIGEDKFDELLGKRNISIKKDEMLELGEEYVRQTKSDIQRLARDIDSTATVEEVMKKLREHHPPDFEGALTECRSLMSKAREFVKTSDFATLPGEESLVIQETPIFMRHFIPFAAYSSPGKFDKEQKGIYMITPVEGNSERLKELSYSDMVNTSVHEGYPGHHLQLVCSNLNPSTARIFSHAVEFIEGWAHYCEDAAAEAGFMNTPQTRLIRAKDILWRAWRIIIDIKLSSGRMGFDEAIGHLVKDVGMVEVGALAEVKRYTYTPGYQLSYLIGKHLLLQLKDKLKKAHAGVFTQKSFHDGLLAAGSLPIYLMEKVLNEKMSKALTH